MCAALHYDMLRNELCSARSESVNVNLTVAHLMSYHMVEMLAMSLQFSRCQIGLHWSQSDGIRFSQWHSCGDSVNPSFRPSRTVSPKAEVAPEKVICPAEQNLANGKVCEQLGLLYLSSVL